MLLTVKEQLNYLLSARIALYCFLAADLLLITLHLAGVEGFNLDSELNIPTLFQTLKLATIATFSLVIATFTTSKLQILSWVMFATVFIYISADEWLQIHERISEHASTVLQIAGIQLRFAAWVVAYSPLMLCALGAAYLMYKTMLKIPEISKLKVHYYLLAGIIFFALVPLVEVIGTWDWQLDAPIYPLLVAIEEGFELFGASSFIAFVVGVFHARKVADLQTSSVS